MWLLAYWWQGLILLTLYIFIFLIYREIRKDNLQEPSVFLLVVKGPIGKSQYQLFQGQIIPLYQDFPLEMQGEKIYVENNMLYLDKPNIKSQKIAPGEIFDYAGGSLQLVRWNNARQLIN